MSAPLARASDLTIYLDRHHLPRTILASFGRLRVLSLSCNAGPERCLSPLAAGTWLT